MFPGSNATFPTPNAQQNANNMNLTAALYLHPSLGIPNQTYTQFYQQAQGQVQLAQQQQQLQRQFEQLVVAQAAQNAHLQAFQQQQQHTFQNQQVQSQNSQKVQVTQQHQQQQAQLQQSQAEVIQIQRLSALRQQSQQVPHSHPVRSSSTIKPRQETQAETDARRRRSLIADFMLASSPTTFLDERGRSDSTGSGVFGETKRSESMGYNFNMIADETRERKKNSITDRLEAVEKEKKLVDNQITIIQRKKEHHESELAKRMSDSADNDKENDDTSEDTSSMSLVERIYAENRKKAFRSEAQLPLVSALSSAIIPQYRNPGDSPLVQQTIERYKIVKPYLVKMLTERRQSDLLMQKYQTEKYNMMYAEWLKKDERYCKSQKKVARDEKHREIFERTFPELRKAREERERCGRAGQLNAEQLEQDEEYKRRCAAAALPPMLLCSRMRNAPFYIDLNGVVKDPLEDHNAQIEYFLGTWTDEEKHIFKEQIVTYGKNFAAIAEFLDRKSVKECVLYYYLTKKRQNYKALMGKKRKKPPRCYKPPLMPRLEEVAQKAPQDANDVTIVGSREFECCMCKMTVNSGSNTGRILTRPALDASGYDASSANEIDIRVCQKCKAKGIKPKVVTRCQVGTCHNPRRKVKPTRPMPAKWKLITNEQKLFLMHQMLIPEDILKCCPACHKKISKQLDDLMAGDLNEEMALWQKSSAIVWSSEELKLLRAAVSMLGTNDWDAIAEKLSKKYNAEQCREQYEEICAMESVKKDVESEEDDVSEDDREQPQSDATVVETKSDGAEAEPFPSGESSATLSTDEAVGQEDCVILSPAVAKSPATHLYKPRFRGTSCLSSEITEPSVDSLCLPFSEQIKKESELTASPLTYRKSDASVSSNSDLSTVDDVAKAMSQPTAIGSALFATLMSPMPDSMPARSSTQVEVDRSPQCSVSTNRSSASTSAITPTTPALVNVVRGSITQGTPVMRPPSTPTNDLLLEKVKQMQMLSAGGPSFTAASNVAISTTAPVATATLQSNINANAAAAAAIPFLQTPLAASASYSGGTPDPNMSSLAAFYNQLAALDPTVQYAMTMKLMQQVQQQEYERRLAMIRASNLVDQYRQQALILGLSEQQQQQQQQQQSQNNHQQQLNALANDQARILLWQQLMQHSTNMKSQQQQQAVSHTANLHRNANTLLAAANIRSAVAAQLNSQLNAEQQKQAEQLMVSAAGGLGTTSLVNRGATVSGGSLEHQRSTTQSLCSAASQLYNDFRNAEQMRKEREENARKLEAQKKCQEEIRYIEQQRRHVVEEEARITEELSRVSQIERALRSQDGEAARVHSQAIERLKERRIAMQHYLRAYDEGLKTLSGRNVTSATGSPGVIVRGAIDDRASTNVGPVSKGAVKEFPPSVTRAGITPSPAPPISGQSLIGIKRTLNDSALATAIDRRVLAGQIIINESGISEESMTSRRSRMDSIAQGKGLDSSMFDSEKTNSVLRSHCHNVVDEEFNCGEHRNIQTSGEIKRKSGIHTVYLPSLPDAHHLPNMKAPTMNQKRVGSPAVSAAARRRSSTPSNPASTTPLSQPLSGVSYSRASPAQQQQFSHFMPTLPHHPARFSPSQSLCVASANSPVVSSFGLTANSVIGHSTPSSTNTYPSGVRTPIPALVSPRTPLSINPNMSGSRSALTSPSNTSSFRVATTPTDSSPFQMSTLAVLSPSITAQSIASSPTFQSSMLISGNPLGASAPSLLVTTTTATVCSSADGVDSVNITAATSEQNEEKHIVTESQQRSESAAVANYEPLSPDTFDEVPAFQSDSSTEQPANLPLFSFLNLPENGNGSAALSSAIRSTDSPNGSSTDIRNLQADTSSQPLSTVTTTGTVLLTKAPPQPTYEPLSDDE